MSAYALPGLFPPIDNVPSTLHYNTEVGTTLIEKVAGPLHEQRDDTSSLSNILKASVDLLYPSALGGTRNGPLDVRCNMKEHGIAVKEAKIDPVRFVKSVTGSARTQQPSHRKGLRRRGLREVLDSPQQLSTSSSKKLLAEEGAPSSSGTPHDEAIEFELSISFNGRKYTAFRTLQCIVQLRDDLIREMNHRKHWLQLQRGKQPFTVADNEDDGNIQIPEIPPISGDDKGHGFVGRGFTMLHAMVTSYVPVMERWLRNVMTIVPQDSECLTNFLWEPLACDSLLEFPAKSCGSLATLGSIKELDFNSDEEDSDDDEF